MSDLLKYNTIFSEIFSIKLDDLKEDFSKETAKNWDSVLQLSLVTAVEEAFDVMFDPEDIMDFTSYRKGKEILGKHGIDI